MYEFVHKPLSISPKTQNNFLINKGSLSLFNLSRNARNNNNITKVITEKPHSSQIDAKDMNSKFFRFNFNEENRKEESKTGNFVGKRELNKSKSNQSLFGKKRIVFEGLRNGGFGRDAQEKSVCLNERLNKGSVDKLRKNFNLNDKLPRFHKSSSTKMIANSPKYNTLFKVERERGDDYFKNAKVGSCKRVVVINGNPLAIAFDIRNKRGEPLNNYKYTLKCLPKLRTTYEEDYGCNKQVCHLGMDNKPLVPFKVNHPRNLLEDKAITKTIYASMSTFNIGDNRLINRKQWIPTYRDYFKPFKKNAFSTNSGINANNTKRIHYKLHNIEYAS